MADGATEPVVRRSRGKLQKSARKRMMILDAAAKLFATRGYAATLTEIAEEAGTQAGSLYYYFASREQLIDELIRVSMARVTVEVRESVESLPGDATWLQKIATGLRAHIRVQLQDHHYGLAYLKLIDQAPPEVLRRHLVLPRDYALFWRELFEGAQAAGEIHKNFASNLIRRLMIGSLNNALRWYDPQHPPGVEEIAQAVCQIFLFGLAAGNPLVALDAKGVPQAHPKV